MHYCFLFAGEKDLSRLQGKVQATVDDFKDVVNYFQYTGEGEEVFLFTTKLFAVLAILMMESVIKRKRLRRFRILFPCANRSFRVGILYKPFILYDLNNKEKQNGAVVVVK